MSSGAIAALITLGVLLIAGAGVFYFLKRRRDKEKARIEAMSPAEREHWDATLEYNAQVKDATAAHNAQVKARDQRLKAANKAVAAATTLGSHNRGHYRGRDGSIALNELVITVNGQHFPLDATITASVNTAGNLATSSRSTFTRVAAGGILFGPVGAIVGASAKKNRVHDMRELYLMVEGTGFTAVITCNPDDGPKVRQLAAAIKQAGMNAAQMTEYRAHQIRTANEALAAETANTAPVDGSFHALEVAKANTSRIEAATAQLAIVPPVALEPVAIEGPAVEPRN